MVTLQGDTTLDKETGVAMTETPDHWARECVLDWCEHKCPSGCDVFHTEKDCPRSKSRGKTQQNNLNLAPE